MRTFLPAQLLCSSTLSLNYTDYFYFYQIYSPKSRHSFTAVRTADMPLLLRSLLIFTYALWCSMFLPSSSAAVLRLATSPTMTQLANGTSWANPNCYYSARPKVSLPDDNRTKSYISSSGLDCLDDRSSHVSDCWDILRINDWLPQWFLQTPQCPPRSPSNSECNERDPPEPWTTTFMRITMGDGNWNGCSDMGNTHCQYHPNPCLGNNDDPLLRARYKYVAYTITSKCSFLSLPRDTMGCHVDIP